MKKAFKKSSSNLILQVVAVAIICGVIFLMYKRKEGFQSTGESAGMTPVAAAIYSKFSLTSTVDTFQFKGVVYQMFGKIVEGFTNEGFASTALDISSLVDARGSKTANSSAGGITANTSNGIGLTTVFGICVGVALLTGGGTYLAMKSYGSD